MCALRGVGRGSGAATRVRNPRSAHAVGGQVRLGKRLTPTPLDASGLEAEPWDSCPQCGEEVSPQDPRDLRLLEGWGACALALVVLAVLTLASGPKCTSMSSGRGGPAAVRHYSAWDGGLEWQAKGGMEGPKSAISGPAKLEW